MYIISRWTSPSPTAHSPAPAAYIPPPAYQKEKQAVSARAHQRPKIGSVGSCRRPLVEETNELGDCLLRACLTPMRRASNPEARSPDVSRRKKSLHDLQEMLHQDLGLPAATESPRKKSVMQLRQMLQHDHGARKTSPDGIRRSSAVLHKQTPSSPNTLRSAAAAGRTARAQQPAKCVCG